jgi:hypothetical protein
MRKPHHALSWWNIKEISLICGVSLKTAQRWKAGQTVPPKAVIAILSRDLGIFDPAWSGWTINLKGELCSPENWIATPGDVLSIQLTQAQLSTYRTENRALKEALAAAEAGYFEEQPSPDQWTIALEG